MNRVIFRNSLIVVCLAVLSLFWWAVMSQYIVYDEVSGKLEQEKGRLEQTKKEIAEIRKAMDRYQAERDEFSKLLFDERDVPAFLDQISKYAKQASINIVDMKTQQFYQVNMVPENVAQGGASDRRLAKQVEAQKTLDEIKQASILSAMPINIKVKGTYASFVRFLDHLQEYKQLISIANVEIRASQEYPLLDCEFVIRIYTLKTIAELQRR